MKDWQLNQQLYKRFSSEEIDDYIETFDHDVQPLVVQDIVSYFTDQSARVVFPAKSYAVAIIYAKLINHFFGDDIIDTLRTDGLLGNNDKYFVPYDRDPVTYDSALRETEDILPQTLLESQVPNVQSTVKYFFKEVLLKRD